MSTCSTVPRLTGTLRAYAGVGDTSVLNLSSGELYEELKQKRKARANRKQFSWEDLKRLIDLHCPSKDKSKVVSLLRQLETSVKALIGIDVPEEELQSASAQVFDLLKGTTEIGGSEIRKLKELFGPFPASSANECSSLVQQIISIFPSEITEDIKISSKVGQNGFNININIFVDLPGAPSFDDEEHIDQNEGIENLDSFVHKFREKLNIDCSTQQTKKGNGCIVKNYYESNNRKDGFANSDVEEFGPDWLYSQCSSYSSSGHGSVMNIIQLVLDKLISPRNNDELQDELFDLLGYEAFELIQVLLQNRLKVTQLCRGFGIHPDKRAREKERSRPALGPSVTIQSEQEKQLIKQIRKDEKKLAKLGRFNNSSWSASEAALVDASKSSLFSLRGQDSANRISYPYVFDSMATSQQAVAYVDGSKILLPSNVERENNRRYEEVFIPPTSAKPPSDTDDLYSITNLDEVGKLAFKGIKKLNRIQSVVFDAAYHSNENLLVCAPTGAGKTNIALLTIVQEIKKNIVAGVVKKEQFKVVYVAPMKALAAEMTANFGKRLEPLGIAVRELTGDMQLTKAEILKTQMLVTTPEKWDVVTRKSTGDVALAQLVKLLIIDEVHLLHDDRGSVIETLVARTIRQVESSQSMIRIIGLSATLPNYLDVARFLNVNPYKGLFFFDGRFRPVPLGQSFIGVKGTNFGQQLRETDEVCYDKVLENVRQGHQVMVFVHARNATVRTALLLREFASNKGDIAQFQVEHTADFGHMEKQVGKSRNKQLRELFPDGFGIHHAGMLRQDRTLMESLFSKGFIKVLVCTATLAWGVNLPAHAVIIKGTEIYDAKKGAFVDLGILDVMQIFGRAGRPQYDTDGHGYIITKHDKLTHYLSLLTRQTPIESQFVSSLTDNLNAEVTLGTVSNVEEAVKWLSYTYLYVRMRINPLAYGITFMDKEDDPLLEKHRKDLISAAGKALDKAKMIRFDERTGYMFPTDLGRIASHYYIKFETIEVINEKFKPFLRDPPLLEMISLAHEFQQLKVRDDEVPELERHLDDCQVDEVKGGVTNEHGKVNILLQTYISRGNVESFSLVSDMAYVAQNAARIIRALFEIALKYGWPVMASRLLALSKTVEKRLWENEHPLRQFDGLNFETLRKLEAKNFTVERLRDMEPDEIGHMIHHVKMGAKVKAIVNQFPMLSLACNIQPITRTVLRVTLHVVPEFVWNDRVHGSVAESWWIWVEDPDNNHIYHSEHFILLKKQVKAKEPQSLIFTIPIFEPLPSQYIVHAISDRWIGAETMCAISFKHLILPERHPPHTELLDLQPLPVTALKNPEMESLYKFSHFNPVQTQIFHTLYYTDTNVLLGAPTGSGKTVAAELGIFKAFRDYPNSKVVYIAPLKALVRERMEDWKIRIERNLKKKVIELTGDVTPDMRAIAEADLIVTTPEKWDGVSRSWQTRNYVKAVSLLVIDEIHLLGDERGPVLEVIVSRTNFISAHTSSPVRVIGLSTALANARDLADWLGIEEAGLFNFRPSVRPVPLEVHIEGFPGKHYCPRMATMNKPCFKAIRTHSPEKPVLIFVSSRRQTRLTAIDLISFLAADDNPKQWMHMAEEKMDNVINNLVTDQNLKLTLSFGIGLHHAGLVEKDRKIVEELFVNQKIQILIATATLAWGVNFPAHLVIVKGTEFFDGKTRRYVDFPITDVLQMMGRAGRPQFDDNGVAVILVQDIKKHFYKKFLYEPFPVESSLLQVLSDHLNAEIVAGTITSKQDAMDYITWTYFFRRLLMNPTYYDLDDTSHDSINQLLSKLVQHALLDLENSMCAEVAEDKRSLQPTVLGRISSYYYLSHKTMWLFRNRLTSISTLEELLTILTDVKEYDELPVRHNEDQLNGALATKLPLKVDQYSYDSPHVKAHLLLQAHFSRVQLPIADYQTDTKSVLDQAIRILQAMIDVAADEGWLATSLRIMHLVQMVTQGRWHHDCPLLCLPNVDHDLLHLFKDKGRSRAHIIDSIPELLFATANRSGLLREMLGKVLSGPDITAIEKVLHHLPQYNVELGVFGVWANQRDGEKHRKSVDTASRSVAHQIWTEVHADQQYALQIDLTKINWSNAKRTDNKAYAPLFPKAKTEGWWFVLGEIDTGELVALKRAGNLRKQQRISMAFYTPEKVGRRIFTLFMMSDSYIGLDQQFDIHLDVIPMNLELQDGTEILD